MATNTAMSLNIGAGIISKAVKEVTVENRKVKCNFCGQSKLNPIEWGPLFQYQGVTVHYFCMLFSAGLSQNGEDEEGILGFLPKDIKKEVKRGSKLKCKFCKEPNATVGCSIKQCKASFHYPCGLAAGCLFQFIDNYASYCSKHRANHEPVVAMPPLGTWECPICFEGFEKEKYPIKPPCCKGKTQLVAGEDNNAVLHRKCVMEQAIKAGLHFFSCPLCRDKDTFSRTMRLWGIYVPERDAEWELEPNAYAEQTQHHKRCDVEPCVCPRGREYDSGEGGARDWKLIRCGGCAAAAVHMRCGNLQNLTYRCDTCSKVLKGSVFDDDEEDNAPSTSRSRRGRTSGHFREDRIHRQRYDSDGDITIDEPTTNILTSLPPHQPHDFEEEEDDDEDLEEEEEEEEDGESGEGGSSSRRDYLPKKQKFHGKVFKVIDVTDTDDSFGSDYDSDVEELEEEREEDFLPKATTDSVRVDNFYNLFYSKKNNPRVKGRAPLQQISANLLNQNRSDFRSSLKFHDKVNNNLRDLCKQMENHEVDDDDDDDIDEQVRTGLVKGLKESENLVSRMVSNPKFNFVPPDRELLRGGDLMNSSVIDMDILKQMAEKIAKETLVPMLNARGINGTKLKQSESGTSSSTSKDCKKIGTSQDKDKKNKVESESSQSQFPTLNNYKIPKTKKNVDSSSGNQKVLAGPSTSTSTSRRARSRSASPKKKKAPETVTSSTISKNSSSKPSQTPLVNLITVRNPPSTSTNNLKNHNQPEISKKNPNPPTVSTLVRYHSQTTLDQWISTEQNNPPKKPDLTPEIPRDRMMINDTAPQISPLPPMSSISNNSSTNTDKSFDFQMSSNVVHDADDDIVFIQEVSSPPRTRRPSSSGNSNSTVTTTPIKIRDDGGSDDDDIQIEEVKILSVKSEPDSDYRPPGGSSREFHPLSIAFQQTFQKPSSRSRRTTHFTGTYNEDIPMSSVLSTRLLPNNYSKTNTGSVPFRSTSGPAEIITLEDSDDEEGTNNHTHPPGGESSSALPNRLDSKRDRGDCSEEGQQKRLKSD